MKTKILILLGACLCFLQTHAQEFPSSQLIEQLSQEEGITLVSISESMFKLFKGKDEEMNKLKSVHIITIDDPALCKKHDLFSAFKSINKDNFYAPLMTVDDKDEVVRFYVHEEGEKVSELLLLVGSKSESVLISIKGDIDLEHLESLSSGLGIDGMDKLDSLEKK